MMSIYMMGACLQCFVMLFEWLIVLFLWSFNVIWSFILLILVEGVRTILSNLECEKHDFGPNESQEMNVGPGQAKV